MSKFKILFVCTFYGGRARIAEIYAGQLGLGQIEVFSSGFESGPIRGLPLAVMEEEGFKFPTDPLVTVFERYAASETYDYVVTLCHEASAEQCPMFRDSIDLVYGAKAQILSWSVPDFLALQGLPEEKLEGARAIRDSIKQKVAALVTQFTE
jgi:arsenate reductase|tara:strand:- start:1156 stop:1611 length:456 start_codon:yes stop_codon:yes gene_type:complete